MPSLKFGEIFISKASPNETQKANIRQRRKQKQDAFWEVTGASYMMDEFSDAKKKKK